MALRYQNVEDKSCGRKTVEHERLGSDLKHVVILMAEE